MRRVLVANRGEIALRVIRACHEEGLEAIAVFSDADRHSPHVGAADDAVRIGPAPAAESYLDIQRLLDAARASRADAVHPGYGFLAESAEFAEALGAAGVTFVGPSADAIRAMGEKTEARRRMQQSDVPVVPGTIDTVGDVRVAARAAADIGYPILLKAVAGGGGKGMRRVESEDDLDRSFQRATSEALKAFGNGDVYVERCLDRSRHVEIQVLADQVGNTIHLGERECSIQRRHQKLIEEAPSPALDDDTRARMGEAAVRAAESVDYTGVGTVEFLLQPDGQFFFLEMNTRIQVEHPVTELVYRVDLVREQLRIAAGQPLGEATMAAERDGHAIECRITSEDPFNSFLPATGVIRYLQVPAGPGVRWDGGIAVGSEIGLHYDPLLAKLVVWGETRAVALARMRRALEELTIVGVATSQPFHRLVMADEAFVQGSYDIEYLERRGEALLETPPEPDQVRRIVVAAALAEYQRQTAFRRRSRAHGDADRQTAWLRAARRDGLR